jgi:hypothetical protein
MKKNELIILFSKLGVIFEHLAEDNVYPGFECGLSAHEYADFSELVERVHVFNPWFTPRFVRESMKGLSTWLCEEELSNWLVNYSFTNCPKRIGLIMAGNIPLVGFHDFLSVIMSGNIAVCKLSSTDNKLWPMLFKTLSTMDMRFDDLYEVNQGKLGQVDAVIATGSDNSARYFDHYFSKYPNIIRKNRTTVAVLTGEETEEDMKRLGHDIFLYFGLGCRNVSTILTPQDFDINKLFKGIYDYADIIMNHHKYINNFDYNRAVYLLNQEDVLENGFALVRFTNELHSPLSVINCLTYSNQKDIDSFLDKHKEQIQVVIGKAYVPFGVAQRPSLTDYADNIDTMAFLNSL